MARSGTSPLPGLLLSTGDDLLDFWQMRAHWVDDCVEHHRLFSDPARRIRNQREIRRWQRQRELNRGAFGTVYLEREVSGQLRAVKEVGRKNASEEKTFMYLREVLAMANLSQDDGYFIKLYGWFSSPSAIHIAMEFAPHGDLHDCLQEPLAEAEVKVITRQLVEALEILHSKKFAHRDLKPSNVFIIEKGPAWWIKLGDFGVSKRVANEMTRYRTSIDTDFTAPEILGFVGVDGNESSSYTNAVDIWSLGCLVHWMLTQNLPMNRRQMNAYCMGLIELPRQHLAHCSISDEGIGFLNGVLQPQPDSRPSAAKLLKEGWLLIPQIQGTSVDPSLGVSDTGYDDQRAHTPSRSGTSQVEDEGKLSSNSLSASEDLHTARLNISRSQLVKVRHSVRNADHSGFQRLVPSDVHDDYQLSVRRPSTSPFTPSYRHVPDRPPSLRSTPESLDESLFPAPARIITAAPQSRTSTSIDWGKSVEIKSHQKIVAVAFTSSGESIFSACDRCVSVWNTATGKFCAESRTTRTVISPKGVVFTSNDKLIAPGIGPAKNAEIFLLSLETWQQDRCMFVDDWRQEEKSVSSRLSTMRISPDGELAAFVDGFTSTSVLLMNIATKRPIHVLVGHEDCVMCVAFSPDGTLIASGSADESVRLWYTATGDCRYVLEGHRDRVCKVVFSSDGELVAASSDDTSIRLYKVATGQMHQQFRGHWEVCEDLKFTPDSKLIAYCIASVIDTYDTMTGSRQHRLLHGLSDPAAKVMAIAISPDGSLIASGSSDRTIKIWALATGERVCTLRGHPDAVTSVAFSSNGKSLVSGSKDGTIRIWGTPLGQLSDHVDTNSRTGKESNLERWDDLMDVS